MIKLLTIKLRLINLRIRLASMTISEVGYLAEKIEKVIDELNSTKGGFIKTALMFELRAVQIIYFRKIYDLVLLEKEG